MEMHIVKVIFENGDTTVTAINGNKKDIIEYYSGNIFNIGTVKDSLQKVSKVEFLK